MVTTASSTFWYTTTATSASTADIAITWDEYGHRWREWEPVRSTRVANPVERTRNLDELQCLARRAEEQAKERTAAEVRSWELAQAVLGEADYAAYQQDGHLDIPSQLHTGQVYRICSHQMIRVIEDGQPGHKLCIHSQEWIPAGDDLICKVLLARHDEERMLATANRHP